MKYFSKVILDVILLIYLMEMAYCEFALPYHLFTNRQIVLSVDTKVAVFYNLLCPDVSVMSRLNLA